MKNKGAPAFQQALFLGFKEYIADLHRPSLTVQFCVGMAYEEGNTPLLEILEKFREEIPGSIGEEGIMLFKGLLFLFDVVVVLGMLLFCYCCSC